MPEKPPVPLWRWGLWWTILGAAGLRLLRPADADLAGVACRRVGGRMEVAQATDLTNVPVFGQLA